MWGLLGISRFIETSFPVPAANDQTRISNCERSRTEPWLKD